MSERQILELGIRAMGIVFIVRAFSDAFSAITPMEMGWGVPRLLVPFACVRLAVAFAMTRYAPQIASRLVEPVATPDNLPLLQRQSWNRWLIASAGAFAVCLLWMRSITNTARTFIFTAELNVGDGLGTIGLSRLILVEALPILFVTYAVFRRPQWIVGSNIHGR